LRYCRILFCFFFFFLSSIILALILIIISSFLSPKKKEAEKLSAFECGFESVGDANDLYSVQYYMVGALFLIFDLEILFMFPWSIHLKNLGFYGYFSFMFFFFLLLISFFFEWTEGALDWAKEPLYFEDILNNDLYISIEDLFIIYKTKKIKSKLLNKNHNER